MTNNTIPNVPRELLDSLLTVIESNGYAADEVEVVDELRAILSAPSPAGVDGLDERMRAAGMLSAAELIAGAPLDAFMKHAGVNDLETFGRWLEMRRGECLRMQGRYDLGERDKSDDMYEWTVAHSAVFGEAHVNFKDALAGNQAIIDGLRGEVAELQAMITNLSRAGIRMRTERDHQAQRIGELREEISDLHRKLDKFYSKSHGIPALAEIERLSEERDHLAALLRLTKTIDWAGLDLDEWSDRVDAALSAGKGGE